MATVRLNATVREISGRVGDTIYYTCRRKTFQRAVSAQRDVFRPAASTAAPEAHRRAVRRASAPNAGRCLRSAFVPP